MKAAVLNTVPGLLEIEEIEIGCREQCLFDALKVVDQIMAAFGV